MAKSKFDDSGTTHDRQDQDERQGRPLWVPAWHFAGGSGVVTEMPGTMSMRKTWQPRGLPLRCGVGPKQSIGDWFEARRWRGAPCGCPRGIMRVILASRKCHSRRQCGKPGDHKGRPYARVWCEVRRCRGTPCGCPRGILRGILASWKCHSRRQCGKPGNHKGCPYARVCCEASRCRGTRCGCPRGLLRGMVASRKCHSLRQCVKPGDHKGRPYARVWCEESRWGSVRSKAM